MQSAERKTHTIDATGKSLGRLATQVANLLRGKTKVGFVPYRDDGDFVVVENISRMAITGKKKNQKIYFNFTGFIGGMKKLTMEKLIEKKGVGEVFKKAVGGMLPKNKLKPGMLKRLIVK